MNTIRSIYSGAAGACAGCDGITTAQKLAKGTQIFDIPSVRRQIVPPPNLGRGGPKFVSKMEHFVRKSRRNFEKILRLFLMKILEVVNKTSAPDQFKNNSIVKKPQKLLINTSNGVLLFSDLSSITDLSWIPRKT